MIQQGINQLFTLVAAGSRFSPGLEKKRQLADIRAQAQALETAQETASEGAETGLAETIQEQKARVAEQEFMLDPTAETLSAYAKQRYDTQAGQSERSTILPDEDSTPIEPTQTPTPEEVQRDLAARGQAQHQQRAKRRNFMEYLRQQPTSLGGTIGDLAPEQQRAIASQYSRSQRRQLMDRMDREGNNG